MFLREGCIEKDEIREGAYRTTPKGKAWVQALCNVEIPREVYIDEYGNVINDKGF